MEALRGYRVLALATNIPGPVAAARLASMGASVVKVEPPSGDPLQHASPSWYDELTRNVTVERRDLRAPEERAWLEAALAQSQLLITTLRAGALARLDLQWTSLRSRHETLSHVAVFGEAPPHDGRAGHDLTYQARAGFIAPPAMPLTLLGDMAAAERVVSASLEALLHHARSGSGSQHAVAIVDAAEAFAAPRRHGLTTPHGPLGGALPEYRLYRAADGWLAVALLERHFADGFKRATGCTGDLDVETIARAVAERTVGQWERLAAEFDLPVAPVSS